VAEGLSISERLASAYKRLAATSDTLNTASDEFSKPIAEIDFALQKLNIGLVTWQTIHGGGDDGDGYWSRDVGYAKVGGKWGLAIRTVNGHQSWDVDDIDEWLFHEAPRPYRIEALEKLPDLLEQIIKNADKTTKKLQEMTVEAKELANAVKQAAEEVKKEKEAAKQFKKERK
jgi:prefoldin subunit 5